jgi:large subunit ribosomal protein L4
MELPSYTTAGAQAGAVTLNDRLFGAKLNRDLVVQVATSQMSNKRRPLAHVKDRSDVAGGGKKPWQQKGTGRARHGSIRSPIWVGGGVAHGPTKDANFKKKVSRSQGRAALAAVLSARVREGRFAVIEKLEVASGKTKDAIAALEPVTKHLSGYRAGGRVLLVLPGTPADLPVRRATENLQHIAAVRAQELNALTVLSFPYLIATQESVAVMEKTFGQRS